MALEYSISGNDGDYYEVTIPIGSYYKAEGLLLSATVCNYWKGFNNEDFFWERNKDKVVLSEDYEENLLEELTLEEFTKWLNFLNNGYSDLDMTGPIIDILEKLKANEDERVYISFG